MLGCSSSPFLKDEITFATLRESITLNVLKERLFGEVIRGADLAFLKSYEEMSLISADFFVFRSQILLTTPHLQHPETPTPPNLTARSSQRCEPSGIGISEQHVENIRKNIQTFVYN